MHKSAYEFVTSVLTAEDVSGKRIIEGGAYDVNGSVRTYVESLRPAEYVGVDMREGPKVDQVMDIADIPSVLGEADIVISTECLEHAEHWQAVMSGLIGAVVPDGILVLTTRSPGFPLHDYPADWWRYPVDAMRRILEGAGLLVDRCESDPELPGVFAFARKPKSWSWPAGLADAWDDAGVQAVAG